MSAPNETPEKAMIAAIKYLVQVNNDDALIGLVEGYGLGLAAARLIGQMTPGVRAGFLQSMQVVYPDAFDKGGES